MAPLVASLAAQTAVLKAFDRVGLLANQIKRQCVGKWVEMNETNLVVNLVIEKAVY